MQWLTEDAQLVCANGGTISNQLRQVWVRIAGRRVMVEDDPQGRSIHTCSNNAPLAGVIPCTLTLVPVEGYSALVRIDRRRVCLSSIRGPTNGSPPGAASYSVADPGQTLVDAAL